MQRLFKQFSFPGGIPSHVAPETPGSIHEGGELGYSLSHAFGAAFDNPNLLVACVIGDGEAETGPAGHELALEQVPQPARATARCCRSCISTATRSPVRRCWRASRATSSSSSCRGYGYAPYFVEGSEPARCTQQMAETLERAIARDSQHPVERRAPATSATRPRWPMIVLRTPKGWTGPKAVDGKPVEGTFRAHQVPIADVKTAGAPALLEAWMRSYQPEQLFDANGTLRADLAALAPVGHAAHERQPARQRRRAAARSAAARFSRLRRRRAARRAPSTPKPRACRAPSSATS